MENAFPWPAATRSLSDRIRLSRRKANLTQKALAHAIRVNRSAVSNWEMEGGSCPSSRNLQRLAYVCQVSHEWLATGRGEMLLPAHVHDVPAAMGIFVDDSTEVRLLQAFRRAPARLKVVLLELSELPVARGGTFMSR